MIYLNIFTTYMQIRQLHHLFKYTENCVYYVYFCLEKTWQRIRILHYIYKYRVSSNPLAVNHVKAYLIYIFYLIYSAGLGMFKLRV
jgi:hypothetical protein